MIGDATEGYQVCFPVNENSLFASLLVSNNVTAATRWWGHAVAAKRRNYWDQKAWGGTEVGEGGVAPHPPLRMSGVAALEIVGQSPALWFVSVRKCVQCCDLSLIIWGPRSITLTPSLTLYWSADLLWSRGSAALGGGNVLTFDPWLSVCLLWADFNEIWSKCINCG